MKKIALFIIILFTGFNGLAQEKEQNPLTKANLKLNILSIFVQTINLSFEHEIARRQSLQLNVLGIANFDYTSFLPILEPFKEKLDEENNEYTGYAITPEYRLYLGQSNELTGVYFSPFFRYFSYEVKGKLKVESTGVGLLTGYQAVLGHKAVVDVFLGTGFNEYKLDYGNFEDTASKSHIRFGFNLGFAF